MAVIWRVRLLGRLQADSDDLSISRFRTRRVGLLLAYLAFYQDRSHSREELAEMLWPESETEPAKRNLRQALFSLRHHLEPPQVPSGAILDASQSLVRLNPEFVETDVAEFNRRILKEKTQEGFQGAIDLYRGDLLPGFYDEWVLRERLNLEDRYVAALQTGIRLAESAGEFDEAVRFTRLALDKDGLQEDLHFRLMQLYIAAGRPQNAIQHFEHWRSVCQAELGEAPNIKLTRLFDEAKRKLPIEGINPLPALITKGDETEKGDAKPKPTIRIPIQVTRYFGRSHDFTSTVRALDQGETKLLTLTGPAGTGKTRLAIEVGRELGDNHGWNVWFVALADISNGANLLDATIAAMKIDYRGGEPLDVLADRLAEVRNLLILDNLEHIVEEAAPIIQRLREAAPNAALLVTSRHSLKLDGEQEVDLGTLPVPTPDETTAVDWARLAEVPSVQLFVDRCRAALPDFQLTAGNARAIGEICRRLDGLPLALEIAAGLAGAFTPNQLLQNLENRLELLRSRRRDLSRRHQSLRAAIDYSYHLISPELQRFFVGLSVFRGGFTIEAAAYVCLESAKSRQGVDECLRMILDLQERSLLQADEAKEDAAARFRLLESYREFGLEQLTLEELRGLRKRHADYYRQKSLDKAITADDRQNRNAAARFLFDIQDVSACVELLSSYEFFTVMERDVVQSLARSPAFPTFAILDRVRLLRLSADAHVYRSEFEEALNCCRQASELAKAEALESELALCNHKLSLVLAYLNRRRESIDVSRQNLRDGLRRGDLLSIELGYTNIGVNEWSLGNFEEARIAYEGAYATSLKRHNGVAYWAILYNLSLVYIDLRRLDEGLQRANEGLRRAQADDDVFGISMCLAMVSRYHLFRGNLTAAIATSHVALVKRRQSGFLYWTFQAILSHAIILIEMGRFREALILFGACRTQANVNAREFDTNIARLKEELDPIEFERAWAEGLSMSLDQAYRFAATFS